MITLLVMTCINVNNMMFCSYKDQHELSFKKHHVETLEELDYYPLPKADMISAAEAIYGSRDRAPRMPEMKEGCTISLNGKEYYYESECKKLRSKMR